MSLPPVHVLPAIRSAPKTSRGLSAEEIQRLRTLPYEHYLCTSWWTARRNQALRQAGHRCSRCDAKRGLQVHHCSYERLGAELDSDLEVVCRGCHVGHHFNETQAGVGLYARIVSEVLAEGRFEDLADVVEEAKCRCAKLNIPYDHERFHVAVARLIPRFPFRPTSKNAELYETAAPHEPLSRAEAAGILQRLGAERLLKHIPQVRPRSAREMEIHQAAAIVAQAILEQVERCEAAERAVPELPTDAR